MDEVWPYWGVNGWTNGLGRWDVDGRGGGRMGRQRGGGWVGEWIGGGVERWVDG